MRRLVSLVLPLLVLAAVAAHPQDKPIVTVLDLGVDQVSESEMKILISLLSSELFQTGLYTVIDVAERDRILQEIEFSVSDCTDESCQIEVGRLLAAEFVVVGRLGMVGERYVLSLKMLETSTSRTVGTADGAYSKLDQVLDDMRTVAGRLAGTEVATDRAETPSGRARSTGRTVAAVSFAAGGVACAAVGTILLVGGLTDLNGPVADAFDAYMAEPFGSAAFDTLYQSYLDGFTLARGKIIPGLALAAGGLALGTVSVVLFGPPRQASAAVSAAPGPDGLRLALRLCW